jgi:hypothetical protein
MDRQQLLARLARRWQEFNQSYTGLPDAAMTEPGVVGDWSVKDLLAHITTWEGEALKALPLLLEGQQPPRYGGVDRFNAQEAAHKRRLTLEDVLQQLAETHRRLLAFLDIVPETYFTGETRFRHRLRLDTYGHYLQHTVSIRAWRSARGL